MKHYLWEEGIQKVAIRIDKWMNGNLYLQLNKYKIAAS